MKRVVTALFLVPVCVYSALFAPWWLFFGVVAIVALLCMREYAAITESFAPLGYLAGVLILFAPPRESLLIFIRPPSLLVLNERLRNRKTEDEASVARRMARVGLEMELGAAFENQIVNDDLPRAIAEVNAIVTRYLQPN